MIVGILKESPGENRVSMLPEGVEAMVKMGLKVCVEKDAGTTSFASNAEYETAGASIKSKADVIKESDLVMKIHNLLLEEVEQFKANQVLMCIVQPLVNKELIKTLTSKKISVMSLDMIPRITRAQSMDVLSSMSTIAGYKAVLLGATYLPKFFPMLTTAAGTIPPAKVLILGAGVAGLMAIATSKRLGGVSEVFDTRPEVKEQVMSLGGKFIEVEGAADASKAGGYAVEQTEEYKQKQAAKIQEHAQKADVIITTALIPGRKAPILITKDTILKMKAGSVIIDLASVNGGNCDLTKDQQTVVTENQVTIIGNSNLASTVPFHASKMFGKNLITLLKLMVTKEGNLNLDFNDEIVSGTCVSHNGEVRHIAVQNALKG